MQRVLRTASEELPDETTVSLPIVLHWQNPRRGSGGAA